MSVIRVASLGVLIATLSLFGASAQGELACRDEEGRAVDWFIAYKFPMIDGDRQVETGHAYSYITSKDVQDEGEEEDLVDAEDPDSNIFLHRFRSLLERFVSGPSSKGRARKSKKSSKAAASGKLRWNISKRLITDPGSSIMRTLEPAYVAGSTLSSVFYNDDPMGTDADLSEEQDNKSGNSRRAHAKGTLLMDESDDTGIWLTHSVPRFPNVRKQPLEYPSNGKNNGQTLMCISIDLRKSGNQIVDHLYNMRPLVYDREVSASLEKRFPNLQYLDLEQNVKGKRLRTEPTLEQAITTRGGQVFTLFSKSLAFDGDLWDNWIDEALGTDLYVQTWRRGAGGVLPSACPANEHHVNNVNDMKYDSQIQWSYIKDHSKWAISDEEKYGTVCIGDSNRMASQSKRGGGAACFKCPACWSAFSAIILDTEPCPRESRKLTPKAMDTSLTEKIRESLQL